MCHGQLQCTHVSYSMPDSSWDTLELTSVLEKPQWSLETNSHNKQFFLRDSVARPVFSKQGFLGVLRPLSSGILKSWWTNIDITFWGWEIYSDGWNLILDQNGPVPIPAVPFFCPILGGFKKALRGFSVEAPEPHSGPFSGRLGSDSRGLPGCNSDSWSVTLTSGL